ncbi:Uncharacterized protein T01_9898 [Trichinella spiralis]|uniref:Major facilitator superfamily (MFS) profile domain-containing protein n=1 Tax=Trichinella spiralis TaxID=6334 RepID=A0A0V1C1U7_TRISP|nr:Uncharacterized protein T01_9898 [Trichinella spiralis]
MLADKRTSKSETLLKHVNEEDHTSNGVDIEKLLLCGPYQALIFLLYQFTMFVQAMNMSFMVYGKVEPNWSCASDGRFQFANQTEKHHCALIQNGSCPNITWTITFYSIVPEWNLICDKAHIVYWIISIQMAGVMIGTPAISHLSDLLGRRKILGISLLLQIILGIASGLSQNWETFAALRFCMGILTGGCLVVVHVYIVESITKSNRMWMMSVGGFAFGFVIFNVIAYFCGHWRSLSIYGHLIAIVPLILTAILQETPRWLLQKKRNIDALKAVKTILRWNKKSETFNEEKWQALVRRMQTKTTSKTSFWSLFLNIKSALYTTCLAYSMFTINLISYGILFTLDELVGNIYFNAFILSIVRWIGSVMTTVLDRFFKCCGRKLLVQTAMAIIATCCTAIAIFEITGMSQKTVNNTLIFIASISTPTVWIGLSLISVELYPTSIRNTALGFVSFFTRLSGVITPQILLLDKLWKPCPFVVFSVSSVLFILFFQFTIPETKGMALVEELPNAREKKSLTKAISDN